MIVLARNTGRFIWEKAVTFKNDDYTICLKRNQFNDCPRFIASTLIVINYSEKKQLFISKYIYCLNDFLP